MWLQEWTDANPNYRNETDKADISNETGLAVFSSFVVVQGKLLQSKFGIMRLKQLFSIVGLLLCGDLCQILHSSFSIYSSTII
jgi:hypothetical protein